MTTSSAIPRAAIAAMVRGLNSAANSRWKRSRAYANGTKATGTSAATKSARRAPDAASATAMAMRPKFTKYSQIRSARAAGMLPEPMELET